MYSLKVVGYFVILIAGFVQQCSSTALRIERLKVPKAQVVILSAIQNTDIRVHLRKWMEHFEVPLVFLVDSQCDIPPSPSCKAALVLLQNESDVFQDILIFPGGQNRTKLGYIMEHLWSEAEYFITSRDDKLLFVDQILGQMEFLFDQHGSPFLDLEEEQDWNEICLTQLGNKVAVKACSFREDTEPQTLYQWIAGKCSSNVGGKKQFPFYLLHPGPVEVLRLFAERVYDAYQDSSFNAVCRPDWYEVTKHNIVWREMMSDWILFSQEHSIKWFLMASALAGSVLQQGHMPYSGDIDIIIFPQDWPRAVQLLQTDEHMRSFKLQRRGSKYLKPVSGRMKGHVPPNTEHVSSFWKQNCETSCISSGFIGKLQHKQSCYGGEWAGGGYVIDFFTMPPRELPPLGTCSYEGFSVPCPEDPTRWLLKEYGADWMIPNEIKKVKKRIIMQQSDPFNACIK